MTAVLYVQVILDEACSAPLLRCCGGGVAVAGRSDAVLLEPALLVLLARAAQRFDASAVRYTNISQNISPPVFSHIIILLATSGVNNKVFIYPLLSCDSD